MRSRSIIVAGLAAALAICAVPLAQASSDDRAGDDRGRTAHHFEGRVTSANLERQTFRMRRNRGTVRFTVTARTGFERIAGFAGLRRGLPAEVTARRADGGWVARKVEPHSTDRGADRSRDRGHHRDD
jgi:Domain of unknown function (DUF5666)